jgi:hypothetical protein
MSGDSSDAKPRANHELKPSKEVESKMRPVSADAFHSLLRRGATTQRAPKPDPKAK